MAIQAEHRLETHGIYGLVRNPSYLGMLVSAIGWAPRLPFPRRRALALLLLVRSFRASFRGTAAARDLRTEYDAYFARTWRLVPWIY